MTKLEISTLALASAVLLAGESYRVNARVGIGEVRIHRLPTPLF